MSATHRWIWSTCSGRATAMRASLWSKYQRCSLFVFKPPREFECFACIAFAERFAQTLVQSLLGNGTGWSFAGGAPPKVVFFYFAQRLRPPRSPGFCFERAASTETRTLGRVLHASRSITVPDGTEREKKKTRQCLLANT